MSGRCDRNIRVSEGPYLEVQGHIFGYTHRLSVRGGIARAASSELADRRETLSNFSTAPVQISHGQ